MASVSSTTESKRIKKFRHSIAKIIPKFPNDRTTLAILEGKPLESILVDYLNWAVRLIPPRKRSVSIESTLTDDPRWKRFAPDTEALLDRVKIGADLTPNLSLGAISEGFTPPSAAPSRGVWSDKDLLLNVMGYHHLHLSQVIEAAGHAKRTDEVLFAQITRTKFCAIGLFNHSVFCRKDPVAMTDERSRLWQIFEQRNSAGMLPGQVYFSPSIALSGHSLHHTMRAIEFAKIIHELDRQLDDLSSRSLVFESEPHQRVKAMKLEWHLNYLDFGLLDKTTSTFYVLRYGPL